MSWCLVLTPPFQLFFFFFLFLFCIIIIRFHYNYYGVGRWIVVSSSYLRTAPIPAAELALRNTLALGM